MPRYFFHVQDGDKLIIDSDGVVISDPEAVRDECRKVLDEALHEEGWGDDRRQDRVLKVVDEVGREIVTVPFDGLSNVHEPLSVLLRVRAGARRR